MTFDFTCSCGAKLSVSLSHLWEEVSASKRVQEWNEVHKHAHTVKEPGIAPPSAGQEEPWL